MLTAGRRLQLSSQITLYNVIYWKGTKILDKDTNPLTRKIKRSYQIQPTDPCTLTTVLNHFSQGLPKVYVTVENLLIKMYIEDALMSKSRNIALILGKIGMENKWL